MEKINVGMIGFGTVGVGVARALLDKSAHIERLVGARVVLKVICDNDLRRKRPIKVNRKILTSDINRVIGNPDIDIVVELVGGIHPAKEFVLRAIKSGQHVVTANKALITEHGKEIFDTAMKAGVEVFYEASVGGGIPIIKALREGLVANEIDTVLGIVNGTSNYILSCMAEDELSFSDALEQAKKKGYAERNPALDIEGYDSAHKLAILTL
ncbi:MAG TPA: homoserine dehydrogenase, partial [Candidatus Omnitrophota bacterium]|nr:homoserine dehydrogenase [Candidatus Omnitrophota bacterium]